MKAALPWLQKRMVWLLFGSYLLGAVLPSVGVAMRDVSITLRLPGVGGVAATLPMFMLGFLLAVAGLGVNLPDLRTGIRVRLLLGGLAVNTFYPIAFAALVASALLTWHNPTETQNVLVGVAIIGAMPIAGATTAWVQNADGNIALSLALVLSSALLSPILTPLGLSLVGLLTQGDYSEDLYELAHSGSRTFVILTIVVPSMLGIVVRAAVGDRRTQRLLPYLKLLNLVDLLILSYSNAALALPGVLAHPDWDFIALALSITATMCLGAFASGWMIARVWRAKPADRIALTYGAGMSNNGTGLVLASSALADHPLVLPPIIFYNLIQQIVAGIVDAMRRRGRGGFSRE
jgi:bile acid:Na+ symporter, BASS family